MRFAFLTRCLMAAVAFAVFTPAAVMAQETKPKMDPEKVFKKRDANGDGAISEDEFLSAAKEDPSEPLATSRSRRKRSVATYPRPITRRPPARSLCRRATPCG